MILALLFSCTPLETRPADLQVDFFEDQPEETAEVRICVDGVGEWTEAARLRGSYAFTGIPSGDPVDVGVDLLDEEGALLAVGRLEGVDGYVEGELEDCQLSEEGCTPCAALENRTQEDAWVLAIRFTG